MPTSQQATPHYARTAPRTTAPRAPPAGACGRLGCSRFVCGVRRCPCCAHLTQAPGSNVQPIQAHDGERHVASGRGRGGLLCIVLGDYRRRRRRRRHGCRGRRGRRIRRHRHVPVVQLRHRVARVVFCFGRAVGWILQARSLPKAAREAVVAAAQCRLARLAVGHLQAPWAQRCCDRARLRAACLAAFPPLLLADNIEVILLQLAGWREARVSPRGLGWVGLGRRSGWDCGL